MPTQTNRLIELREAAEPGEIPYLSKSRIKKWVTCPEQFNFSYLKGYKEPENRYMRRGTDVHETFEDYYANAYQFVEIEGRTPTLTELVDLLPESSRWFLFSEPYISNFLLFEMRRARNAPTPEDWLPVEVEGEAWLDDPLGYGDDSIPMMGYADAIYPASGFPEIDGDDGVVIVDFKTGRTPNEKYRDEGIYLEGEYYAMLFESEWDVAGVAGYYPKNDDLIVSPLKESRREKILSVAEAMQEVSGMDPGHLEIEEQPLCYYGEEEGQHCPYYSICESRWGEPLKHADRTREMFAAGMSPNEIAAELDCEPNHVYYAKKKLVIS